MKTGIDIVEVERIAKIKKSFIKKIFTEHEIAYAMQFENYAEHLAGFFCAKEAVMKALEVGIDTLPFSCIEILHTQNKKPFAVLSNKAKELFDNYKYSGLEVSISHTSTYATAICIIF